MDNGLMGYLGYKRYKRFRESLLKRNEIRESRRYNDLPMSHLEEEEEKFGGLDLSSIDIEPWRSEKED